MAIPAYRDTVAGDVPGVTLTRISDNSVFGLSNGQARHRYSKRPAWNANETRMDVGNKVLDGSNYDILVNFIPLSSARSWSYTDPNMMFGIAYDPKPNVFTRWNANTGELQALRVFSEYDQCSMGSGEGSLSNDDRYVALVCHGGSRGVEEVLSYDIRNDEILGRVATRSDYNWASVSSSGSYIVVENNASGSSDRQLVRYDLDMQNRTILTDKRHHGDMGVDNNGDDVYVMINWDYISYIRLKDGARVRLGVSNATSVLAGHGHISCRATQRPGWCYVSSYEESRVGAFRLGIENETPIGTTFNGLPLFQGVAEFELWGYHRSSGSSYDVQAKASVSPSGRKIVVTSDIYGRGEINDYVLAIEN